MDKLANQIIGILEREDNLKAIEIAKKLDITRKLVNHYLHLELQALCVQNDKYEWKLKTKSVAPTTSHEDFDYSGTSKEEDYDKTEGATIQDSQSESDEILVSTKGAADNKVNKVGTDDKLQLLCRYYIDCILLEQDKGIEVYEGNKFGPNYVDVVTWPTRDLDLPDEANDMIHKVMTSNAVVGYFGYPTLLKKTFGNKKLAPVFLWELDSETGKVDFSSAPMINTSLIKHYVVKSNEAVVKELVRLEKELGIYNDDKSLPISELVGVLQNVRQWQWADTLNPSNLSKESFGNIENEGIYNKAILLTETKSPYTKGLISELQKLSEMKLEDCRGTALYDWITSSVRTEHDVLESELLEVLPLNAEQKQSIEKSLTGDLTVITGPPGTGKSQVVINLLINKIYNKQSVLFSSKNSKAVDVVIKRANELTKQPFIAKLGGKNGNDELKDILGRLLDSEMAPKTREKFTLIEKQYQQYRNQIDSIKNDILVKIDARNTIDSLDQENSQYRNRYQKLFEGNEEITVEGMRASVTELLEARFKLFKENQSFFARLKWKSIKEQKEEEALNKLRTVQGILQEMDTIIPPDADGIRAMDIEGLSDAADKYFKMLTRINAYKSAKKRFSKTKSIETLERELFKILDKYYDSAREYWDAWLSANRTGLNANDKQTIIEYLNGIKLISGQEEDDIIPDDIKKLYRKLQKAIPKYINAQAVTLLSAKNRIPFSPGCFDLLIIDEASQCDIASALPLLFRTKKAVIIGDLNQLAHVSTLSKRRDAILFEKYRIQDLSWLYSVSSLFALAQSRAGAENVVKLKEHHRSHCDIIEFSNDEFYGGDLITATKYDKFSLPAKEHPGVRWINVKGNALRPSGGGARNEIEAAAIVNELERFDTVGYKGGIGVISPFRKQAEHIRNILMENEPLYTRLVGQNHLEINTVHQFQGDERDVIIFSPTIATGATDGMLLFLKENGNLFNVAITRARAMLITIGDREYAETSGISYLSHFAKYVDKKMIEYENDRQSYNIEPSIDYPQVSNMDQVSDWEVLFYRKLHEAGVVTYPQYPVDKFKLDLAIVSGENKLDIEVDGKMYHQTWDGDLCYRDQLRNQRLYELGWDVIRFWVPDLRDNMSDCIQAVKDWMSENSIELKK